MSHTLEDLTDEEYAYITEQRLAAKRGQVIRTITNRMDRNRFNGRTRDSVYEWLSTWTYDDLVKLAELYQPTNTPTVGVMPTGEDEEVNEEAGIRRTFDNLTAPAPTIRGW